MNAPKSAFQQVHSTPPVPVHLPDIEKEMGRLWNLLSRDVAKGQTLTRACMSNLVIYCDTQAEAATVLEDLPKVLAVHPARVLLLIAELDEGESELKAYVSVHYCPVSEGWQLCAEQVTVYCKQSAAKRLPSIPRALCVGDLPKTLWWASGQPPPVAGEIFHALAAGADQVIFDSIGWRDPVKGVLAVSHWIGGNQDQVIYNLAWRRLKAWRKLISEALAPSAVPGALHTVNRLEIQHGPHALPVAWLLVGWLASRLNWIPVSGSLLSEKAMTWRFECEGRHIDVLVKRRSQGSPWIYQLAWGWAEGEGGSVMFSQFSERKLGVKLGVKIRTTPVADTVIAMPATGRACLVAAQMAYRFHDELFEEVQAVCNRMAAILLK